MVKIKKVSESGTGEDKSLRKEKGEKRKGRQREQHKGAWKEEQKCSNGTRRSAFSGDTCERKPDKRHVGNIDERYYQILWWQSKDFMAVYENSNCQSHSREFPHIQIQVTE